MNSSTSILFNSPALKSLQRKQLVSLCKRYKLKASGKNSDLVGKLQAFAISLPAQALTDPSFSLADFVSDRPPASSDTLEAPFSDRAGSRESEAWEVLDDLVEENEGGSWKSAQNGGAEGGGGEFGTRKAGSSTSLSKSTVKSFKAFLERSQASAFTVSTASSRSSSSAKRSSPPVVAVQDESMDVDHNLSSEQPGVAHPVRPLLAKTEPIIRMDQSSSGSSLASSAHAPSPPHMAARSLVKSPFCFATSSSPSSLHPIILAKDDDDEDSIPGSFPSTSSGLNHLASPPPFVFGNPRHSISNSQFRSPVIASATPSMSMREVMEEEMRKRMVEKGVVQSKEEILALPAWMVALGQPGGTMAGSGVGGSSAPMPKKRRFDDVHEKEFAKMPSIADHYSSKRVAQPPAVVSTSQQPARPKPTLSRPIQNGRRPSSLLASGAPRYRPSPAAAQPQPQPEGPSAKRAKVSFSAVTAQAPVASSIKGKEREMIQDDASEEAAKVEEDRAKARRDVKRKLAMQKARRSSVAGRRVSGGKARLPVAAPKGTTSRFGFLHHGVEAMRKGVASFLPASSSTVAVSACSSSASTSTSASIPKSSSIPKLSSLLASSQKKKDKDKSIHGAKQDAFVKTPAPAVKKTKTFFGGSKKTAMLPPPLPTTIFKPSPLNVIPAASSSSLSRAAIPNFTSSSNPPSTSNKSLNRLSTVSSIFSARGPSSSTKDKSSVSSRAGSTSTNRTTVVMVSSRPNSSLLAPTASSLARQRVGPTGLPSTGFSPALVALASSSKPNPVRPSTLAAPPKPVPTAAANLPSPFATAPSIYPSLPPDQPQQRPRITSDAVRLVPKKASLANIAAAASSFACAYSVPGSSSFPSLAVVQPLFPSLPPATNTTAAPATPKPYKPAFKARVASKLAASQAQASSRLRPSQVPGKKRSSVATTLLLARSPAPPTPASKTRAFSGSSLGSSSTGGKGRKSVPNANAARRRETLAGVREKGRGRRSEGGLGLHLAGRRE